MSEEKPKKTKQVISDRQKEARRINLAKGRAARQAKYEKRKSEKKHEYNIDSGSSEEDDEIDLDSYVLSKKEKEKSKDNDEDKEVKKEKKKTVEDDSLKQELKELREIVFEVAKQKKQKRKSGGTKIVLLPNQQTQKETKPSNEYNTIMNQFLAAMKK